MRSGSQGQRGRQQQNGWSAPSCPQCGLTQRLQPWYPEMVGVDPLVRNVECPPKQTGPLSCGHESATADCLVFTHLSAMRKHVTNNTTRLRSRNRWSAPSCPQCRVPARANRGVIVRSQVRNRGLLGVHPLVRNAEKPSARSWGPYDLWCLSSCPQWRNRWCAPTCPHRGVL